MYIRCPHCRQVSTLEDDLLEHLARCQHCNTLLHVQISRQGHSPCAKTIARLHPRPVAIAAVQPSGIFAFTPTNPQEDPGPSPWDETLAALSEARNSLRRRPRTPMPQPSLLTGLVKFCSLSAATFFLIAAVAVSYLKVNHFFDLPQAYAAAPSTPSPPPTTTAAPDPATPMPGELFPHIAGQK